MAQNGPESTGFATRAIHHAYDPSANEGALVPPLHLSSTFTFESAQHGADVFAGDRPGHFYTRISNPTTALLEARLAALEGAEAGLATASGMGAITSTLWTLLKPGDRLLTDHTLYGCTHSFFEHGLTRFGIEVDRIDLNDDAALTEAMARRPAVVYFETPANPDMRLVDIKTTSQLARAAGAVTVVDNTYATPYLTQPLAHGADIVIHSATKYLGGHGDLVGGLVAGSAEQMEAIRLFGLKDMTGAAMSPFNAMLVMRGLKTLELRMDRHCQSATRIARWLEAHPATARVLHPALDSFPQAALAKRQMSGPGGMIALELHGGHAAGRKLMDGLTLISRAVSLGDAETLIQHPASMTHSTYTPEERAAFGLSEGLIRLSIGLETPDDILADLAQSLAKLSISRAA